MLIDKQRFEDDLIKCKAIGRQSLMVMIEVLNSQPAVEAEPVVHCKNCAFFDEYSKHPKRYLYKVEGADGVCFLRRLNSDNSQFHARRFEDFCSDGEKATDETD